MPALRPFSIRLLCVGEEEACHMLEGIEAAKMAEHASNTAVV